MKEKGRKKAGSREQGAESPPPPAPSPMLFMAARP